MHRLLTSAVAVSALNVLTSGPNVDVRILQSVHISVAVLCPHLHFVIPSVPRHSAGTVDHCPSVAEQSRARTRMPSALAVRKFSRSGVFRLHPHVSLRATDVSDGAVRKGPINKLASDGRKESLYESCQTQVDALYTPFPGSRDVSGVE